MEVKVSGSGESARGDASPTASGSKKRPPSRLQKQAPASLQLEQGAAGAGPGPGAGAGAGRGRGATGGRRSRSCRRSSCRPRCRCGRRTSRGPPGGREAGNRPKGGAAGSSSAAPSGTAAARSARRTTRPPGRPRRRLRPAGDGCTRRFRRRLQSQRPSRPCSSRSARWRRATRSNEGRRLLDHQTTSALMAGAAATMKPAA
ncbi:hypothetical protein GQ55_9G526600 [Panicum hallii var. hallii]|uniref:Uncharacterized protein n=1 Tax=Panicum hallii var. hallii TaxID=1504633 RepID=A0A2T7CEN6_9POAL|nr:hypothetical protein GQ55_9G526600 [Panicum hallii var. hallii]